VTRVREEANPDGTVSYQWVCDRCGRFSDWTPYRVVAVEMGRAHDKDVHGGDD
jgi:hypothetical protein